MDTEFKLPELGENIESAGVLSVLVKPGDAIEKEQSVIEIETDKATIEVPSSVEGTVKDVNVKEGDNVKVGQVILTVEDGGTKSEKPSAESKSEVKPEKKGTPQKVQTETKQTAETKSSPKKVSGKTEQVEVKLPELGENIESANVLSILVKSGDNIQKDQSIIEIETDKATIEVPSPVDGKIVDVLIKEGEQATVGQTLLKVETGEAQEAEETQAQQKVEEKHEEIVEQKPAVEEKQNYTGQRESVPVEETDSQPPIKKGAAPAAPSVRRIARELGVDISKVPGSGPHGRISMDDVKLYVKKLNEARDSSGGGMGLSIQHEALPDFSKFGEIERKAMSTIRAKTATHLSYAWASIPHVTQFDKADITELEKVRKAFNPKVEKAGGKLTVTAILLKVIASALKVFPQFNSSINMEKKEIIFKKYFHIGIAVDTEHGLIVPVLKDVNKKNLVELSIEMNAIAEKARIRKIGLEDLQGACFTITNLGGIGGTSFTPIVNSPEVAILGVSRGKYEPVYIDGKFEPRMMLPLSLSYDHRIIDGADAARFLRWVCEALEQPLKILIEG